MTRFLTERQVVDLMGTDPLLTGAVEALDQAFRAATRGEISTPEEERLRVVWPPGQQWRPYQKDIRILPAMMPGLGVAGIHLGCNALDDRSVGGDTSYMVLLDFTTFAPIAIICDARMHDV